MINIKRVYEVALPEDGLRVLVDRLWPRGVSKQNAKIDVWLKDIAPSAQLRTWYNHQDERFEEFKKLYQAELSKNPALSQLKDLIGQNQNLTLVYASKSPLNQAVVLRDYLQN